MIPSMFFVLTAFVVFYIVLHYTLKASPASGFKSFMLSGVGKVLTGLIAAGLLFGGLVCLMILSGGMC